MPSDDAADSRHGVPSSGGMDFPDEYPRTNTGTTPPFAPTQRPSISSGTRNHILQRHRHDGSGRTRFRRSWSDDDIMRAVDLTVADPDDIRHFGDQFVFLRTVDDERLWVTVRTDKPRPFIRTAYPLPA